MLKIEVSERGKVGTWSDYTLRSVDKENTITYLYSTESGATVPMKQ